MIQYIQNDLFSTKVKIIAHGVNCSNGFGSGIAGIISKKFPYAKKCYHDKYIYIGWSLGDIQCIKCGDKIIVNIATQQNYGNDGKVYIDYENGIEKGLRNLFTWMKSRGYSEVAMPKIGAGLGGGDWNIISDIIERLSGDIIVKVFTGR